MKKNVTLFVVIFLCAAAFVPALGRRDAKTVEVSGRVRLVGSSPSTSLVISAEDRTWYIEEKDRGKLMYLQQQTVTVRGTEYYRDLTFANGDSAGRRYILKNIKLVTRPVTNPAP